MKLIYFALFCVFLNFISCIHTSSPSNPITSLHIRSLDFATLRPRIISLLGRDSAGLDPVSMITSYEDFLSTQYTLDTTIMGSPPDDGSRSSYGHRDPPPWREPNDPKIKERKVYTPPPAIIQLLRQQEKLWLDQLDDFHDRYYRDKDIPYAKKGVAAGYNALISGPTLSDLQKIEDKIMPIIDTLQVHVDVTQSRR